jgi:hypothetical protein
MSRRRRNPTATLASEYWITERGGVEVADDRRGLGHETIVAESLARLFLRVMKAPTSRDHFIGALLLHRDEIVDFLKREGMAGADLTVAQRDLYRALAPILRRKTVPVIFSTAQQFDDAFGIAWGASNHDARVYAMKYDGWKRVARSNIETWTLTRDDLATIARGLAGALGVIGPDEAFNIEVRSTGKYYTGVPWPAIESGDVSEVTRGHSVNPRKRRRKRT